MLVTNLLGSLVKILSPPHFLLLVVYLY